LTGLNVGLKFIVMKVNFEALKALRLASGESQVTLANRAGVSEQALNRIERGRSLQPRVGTLKKLSVALGVPISEFAIAESAAERKAFGAVADLREAS
jgi:transcriptional regulator with XRE-family HTH domain